MIWRDREGKPVTAKEFVARFKGGIAAITPLQNVRVTLMGQVIVLIGIVLGIIINIVYSIWWLVIILFGSLFIAGMSFIGTMQKFIFLEGLNKIEKEMEGGRR